MGFSHFIHQAVYTPGEIEAGIDSRQVVLERAELCRDVLLSHKWSFLRDGDLPLVYLGQ